jgi:hypothetical protein
LKFGRFLFPIVVPNEEWMRTQWMMMETKIKWYHACPGAKMVNFFNDHLRLIAVLSSPAEEEEKLRTKNLLKTPEK